MRPRGLSHRTIVELLGTQRALAEAVGLERNSVAHWKKAHRGIPPLYWPMVVELLRKRGYAVTLADLARTCPTQRTRRQRRTMALPDDDTPSQELAAA